MAENQNDGFTATWLPGYTNPIDLDPYMYPAAHAEKYDTRKEWATSPQMYHNEIANDYVTNVSKNLSGIPYAGNFLAGAAELGAPVASAFLSLPYELKQSFADFEKLAIENPEKYNSLGSTASGILQAIDDQNPLSTVYHRTKGALRPLGRRLENTWEALKNEFSGDVEAAEQVEPIGPQRFETNSKMPVIDPNLNRLREEYEKNNPGIWEALKNEFSGSANAEEMTIEELRDYFEGIKPEDMGLPKRGQADWEKYMRGEVATVPRLSNEEYLAQNNLYAGSTGKIDGVKWIDEETVDEGIPGTTNWQKFLSKITRQPYRGAAQGAYGYTPTQLNSMNALGGYYSEPARAQRQFQQRGINVLNRAAAGKAVGNVNKLLGQYGYSGTPGSGTLQFRGTPQGDRSQDVGGYTRDDRAGWSRSPFKQGGLATMFERRR